MGNTESMESQLAVIRSRAAPVRLPMPDPAELEERFSIALVNTTHTHTHAREGVRFIPSTHWTALNVSMLAC